jgi:PIN domain nuclease of toxin-antitoxin system
VKRVVLDASALLTFFLNRPGASKVAQLIQLGSDRKRQLLMSVLNWGEVYYSIWADQGPGVARNLMSRIEQLPIGIVPVDLAFARAAAELKADQNLPYADGFAAALAIERKASLATSDKDFAKVERQVRIIWITG